MEDCMTPPEQSHETVYGCDRETFERVWRRVMPQQEHSPIQIKPPEAVVPPARHMSTEAEPPQRPRSDCAEVCFGHNSRVHAPRMRMMIDGETEDWRFYRALASRATQRMARILRSIAADEQTHIRRLSAAYFIINGQRYRSPNQDGTRPLPALMPGLREQFIAERQSAHAYHRAAQDTADSCLRQLFEELAQDEQRHARILRTLLEQM